MLKHIKSVRKDKKKSFRDYISGQNATFGDSLEQLEAKIESSFNDVKVGILCKFDVIYKE